MSNEHTAETDVAAAIAITREAEAGVTRPLDPENQPFLSVTVPNGYSRETIDLRKFRTTPWRTAGTVCPHTVEDLVRYVQRHDDAEATTVWVDGEKRQVVAVLDDHGVDNPDVAGMAGWGEHRAVLALRHTDEWLHWVNGSGESMTQEEFAEHIEDGQVEVTKPVGADLLEIAMSMQGSTNAEWKSATRLHDGSVHFLYNEDATATAGGAGELDIPQTFELLIAPFVGENPVALTARLRYRIRSGKLSIGYKLDRPNDAVRDCIDLIGERLAAAFGRDRVFVGTPRSQS